MRLLRACILIVSVCVIGSLSDTNSIADSWNAMSTTGAPIAREFHSAVSDGSRILVWGGTNGVPKNDGAIYDPVLNNWTSMSGVGAPSARFSHTAIWTGSQMIVWGGSDGIEGVPSGGRYDPVANSWSATSTTGAPFGRVYHTAVWTGSKMIIWGGETNPNNTGGVYDPVSNSWTATSTTGAPTGRTRHTAVWTGTKMVIWGGDGFLNTGGVYDPSTNSWTATTTTGAPAGRTEHTAIMTSGGTSKMIVWGGRTSINIRVNTGGFYDPVANSWTATSTTGAPAVRNFQTAIWTEGNSMMIVWGGLGTTGLKLNTGGRLDVVANTWSSTSTTGAPVARAYHTATYQLSKMYVWGGENGSNVEVNSGAKYNF